MSRLVRCRRCPRCGGWLYVEADRDRLDDYYVTCGLCGWERYLGKVGDTERLRRHTQHNPLPREPTGNTLDKCCILDSAH